MRAAADAAAAGGEAAIYRVAAVDRAISLLHAFTPRTPELALSQLASRTGLHRATALRLLRVLARHGLIEQDAQTARYRLGLGLIGLAETAKQQTGLVARALPAMRQIQEHLNETCFLSVRAGDSRVNIEQLVGLQELRRVVSIGDPKPLYVGASSKVLLAGMPDEWIDAYLARTRLVPSTAWTITDPARLREEIARIRRQGYAEAIREGDAQSTGAAAPLRDALGQVVAAVAISIPYARHGKPLMAAIIDAVLRAAAAISPGASR